jgi:hypothetical protein
VELSTVAVAGLGTTVALHAKEAKAQVPVTPR